jgi:hypothetical protein
MGILQYSLWLSAVVLLSVIGYRIWSRRLYRDYPLFSAYIVAQLIRFPVVFYYYQYYYQLGILKTYRHVYLYAETVDAVLKFGVICELFSSLFRPYDGIRSWVSVILRWASVIFLLVAVLVAAASTSYDSDTFLARFYAMERSVEIVQGGLLFLMFALSSSLSLKWKPHAFGIALGFGVVTSVNLAAFTLRARLGVDSRDILSLISSAGYNCGVLVWLVTLYAGQPVRQRIRTVPHWDVESWNRALGDFLRR